MATNAEIQSHPLAVGLNEWYSRGIHAFARVSNILAIPMFWHIGCSYREGGWGAYKNTEGIFQILQYARTAGAALLGIAGWTAGDQRLFAIGTGFTVGGLLDMAISTILVTGIKEKSKAIGIDINTK